MQFRQSCARALAAVVFAIAGSSAALAQSINVGSGAGFDVNDGRVDVGCGDLIVSGAASVGPGTIVALRNVNIAGGTLALGSGALSFSGDWTNTGSFIAGASEVRLVDGCTVTTTAMTGDTVFHRFSATTTAGRQLQVAAGSTQRFGESLTLRGEIGNPLTIRSSSPGAQAAFVLPESGTQDISGVDVADNSAAGGQTLVPSEPGDAQSVDAGNNTNWFIAALPGVIAEPIATLPLPGLLILAAALALLARRFLRSRYTLEATLS